MDRLYNLLYMYKSDYDCAHGNLCRCHMQWNMDLCIFVAHKPYRLDIQSSRCILACNSVVGLHTFLRMYKLLVYLYLDRRCSVRMEMGYRDFDCLVVHHKWLHVIFCLNIFFVTEKWSLKSFKLCTLTFQLTEWVWITSKSFMACTRW